MRITLYDHRGTPQWRSPDAALTSTESVRVSGTFTAAAECLPWRTSGS